MKNRITPSLIAIAALGLIAAPASAKIETGQKVTDVQVTDTYGETHNLSDFAGKNVVLEWTNDACPFVKKHYNSDNMQDLQKAASNEGDTVWLTIASSGLAGNAMITADRANSLTAEREAAPAAFILDEGAKTAQVFSAKTTPHMYVINADQELVYQGAIDDKRGTSVDEVATANNYVTAALGDLRAGRAVQTAETVAYGCPVKYGDEADSGRAGPPPGGMGPRPDAPPPPGARPEASPEATPAKASWWQRLTGKG